MPSAFRHWFSALSRPTRYLLVGLSFPLVWSLLFGIVGFAVGSEKVDSIGSQLLAVGLLLHFPMLLVLASIFPALPMGAGDDGGFEVMLLLVLTIPSCFFYGLIGWIFGKIGGDAHVA